MAGLFVALQGAELARELKLLLVRQRLVVDDEHRMFRHRVVDESDVAWLERRRAVDPKTSPAKALDKACTLIAIEASRFCL